MICNIWLLSTNLYSLMNEVWLFEFCVWPNSGITEGKFFHNLIYNVSIHEPNKMDSQKMRSLLNGLRKSQSHVNLAFFDTCVIACNQRRIFRVNFIWIVSYNFFFINSSKQWTYLYWNFKKNVKHFVLSDKSHSYKLKIYINQKLT
jgi:hypothetical protein